MAIVNDAFRDYQVSGGKQSLATFTTLYYVYGIDAVYALPHGNVVSAVEDLIVKYNLANPSHTLPIPIKPTTIPPVENPGGGNSTTNPNTGDTGKTCYAVGTKEFDLDAYNPDGCCKPIPGASEFRRCSDGSKFTPISLADVDLDKMVIRSTGEPISYHAVDCTATNFSYFRTDIIGSCNMPQQPEQKEQACCDSLTAATNRIADVLQSLSDKLNNQYNNVCDNIDKCTDKIIANIEAKYAGVTKTCEQCQSMLRAGMSGTIEYALTCASKQCERILCECSASKPECEGKECKGCGKEPCCCKDGECLPCETKPADKDDYIGWCNRVSGIIIVTKNDEPAPGVNFERVSSGADRSAVEFAAYSACQAIPQQPDKPKIIVPASPQAGSLICSVEQFTTNSGIDTWITPDMGTDLWAGFLTIVDALSGDKSPLFFTKFVKGSIASALGCKNDRWENVFETLAAFSYVSKATGVDLQEQMLPFRYALNGMCQHRQLTSYDAMRAYLSNGVNEDTFNKLWQIEGFCPDAIKAAKWSSQSRPVPNQLAALRRRNLINYEQYHCGMRELGYLNYDSDDKLYKLSENLPTLTDILRFMVRDADDEDLVKQFGLDTGFTDKYRSQLKQWSEWQGIPENVAQYAWRSHWQIPSPTQLFEFWHRLRYNKDFGGKEKLLDDIKAALIQQDILPYWHEHYLAVSFHPLTRVDARRGFELGSLSKEQLKASFIDQGYSDENADILVTYSERRRIIVAQGHKAIKLWIKLAIDREEAYRRMTKDGLPGEVANAALDDAQVGFESGPLAAALVKGSISKDQFIAKLNEYDVAGPWASKIAKALSVKITNNSAIEEYGNGTIGFKAAWDRAVADGMDVDIVERELLAIDAKIDGQLAANCQRSVKRRFLLGEFNDEESISRLIQFGVDKERATKLANGWHCEMSSIGKAIPAAKLCSWLERGVLQPVEFVARLIRIGYTRGDADLMVQDCLLDIDKKRAKAAAKAAKEEQAARDKEARQQKQNQNAAQRAANAEQKRTEAANKARTMRAKIETSAAEKIVKHCGSELYDAIQLVSSEKKRIMSENPISIDDALQVLVLAAENYDCLEVDSYKAAVDSVLLTFISEYVRSTGE